jgi:hypothetical protein
MKGKSSAKANFKVSTPKGKNTHVANGPAVPAEYARNMAEVGRVSARAMRVARRGR